MKLFDRYFWGILLILIGAAYIGERFLDYSIPTGTIIISFILIYSGLAIAFGKSRHRYGAGGTMVFSAGRMETENDKDEYNIIFSTGTVELSDVSYQYGHNRVKINTIFSNGTVFIGREMPVLIKIDAAFANGVMPDGTSISFGEYTYKSKNFKQEAPFLEIKADVVFGRLQIVER